MRVMKEKHYSVKELIEGKVFYWRAHSHDSYMREIRRAMKLGFDVGRFIGENKRGTWIIFGEELLKYIAVRSKDYKVIKVKN